MKNIGVSHKKYRLCGFLNLHPFFPAFVYPVFCRSDAKGNAHYYFEDGRKCTIQEFHELDLQTFPKKITPSNLGHSNYTAGSDTVYAYALSPDNVVWGIAVDVIPRLKSILPTLQSDAQKKRVNSFISRHRAEYHIQYMRRFFQDALVPEWENKALQVITWAACLLALAYIVSVFGAMGQKTVRSEPDDEDELLILPDDDIPLAYIPDDPLPDGDDSSVHYQRLNVTSSSIIIDYLTNTFVSGDPYSDDSGGQLTSGDVLAVDSQSGKEYDMQELVDTLLLIPYRDGPQETFFYGSLSTEGKWHGRCVTNVYEDHKLQSVIDACYDNGKLLSYEQVYTYTTKKGELVWAFSSRIVQEDNSRSGETWTYYYDDIFQNFSYDNVTEEDIILADHFDSLIERIGGRIEGYYNGNTSNGIFNDSTGHAYMVKYFKEDGTVRTLYVGKVENGDFSDQTGSAWEIGKITIDQAQYAYFIGTFSSDGKYDIGDWKYNLKQEDIDALLDGYTFNCPLPGLQPDEQEDVDLPS